MHIRNRCAVSPHLGCGGEVPEGALLVDEGPGGGQGGARRHHRHPAQHGQLLFTDRFLIPVLSTSYHVKHGGQRLEWW